MIIFGIFFCRLLLLPYVKRKKSGTYIDHCTLSAFRTQWQKYFQRLKHLELNRGQPLIFNRDLSWHINVKRKEAV